MADPIVLNTRPWDGTILGDAGPYSADDWQFIYECFFDYSGIFKDVNGAFKCSAGGSNIMTVAAGAGMIRGILVWSDEQQEIQLEDNVSGLTRIDRIVLEVTWTTQNGEIKVLTGTPAGSPVPQALTQIDGTRWQIPLCNITLIDGYTVITDSLVIDERTWLATVASACQFIASNRSGSTMITGQGATPHGSLDLSITDSNRHDKTFLGVIQGYIGNGLNADVVSGFNQLLTDAEAIAMGEPLFPTALNSWTPYDPLANHNVASIAQAIAMEGVDAGVTEVRGVNFPRHMIYPRFQFLQDSVDFTTTSTTATNITGASITLFNRGAPMLIVATLSCHSTDANEEAEFNVRNGTDNYLVKSTSESRNKGIETKTVTILAIDNQLTPHQNVTYHLTVRTVFGIGDAEVYDVTMFVVELGF